MQQGLSKKEQTLVPLAVLVAGAIVIGTAYVSTHGFTHDLFSRGVASLDEVSGEAGKPQIGDDVVLGAADAPVTLIEFSDYQCPFCARFFSEVEGRIKEEYIATGKVRMVYKDYAILGPASVRAAEAAECARDQGKYWQYHDTIFLNSAGERSDYSQEQLGRLAQLIDLDLDPFMQCVRERKYKSEVEGDIAEAGKAGVTGTPTVFINGKRFVGALPYEKYSEEIERILSGASVLVVPIP